MKLPCELEFYFEEVLRNYKGNLGVIGLVQELQSFKIDLFYTEITFNYFLLYFHLCA
jgi:hypothetical protein